MSWLRGAALLVLGLLACAAAAKVPGTSTGPSASDDLGDSAPIILSPVEPMDGRDVGGLGGIHKLELLDPSLVFSNGLRPGDQPAQVLTAANFQYLRRFGVAIFGGTDTGGRASLRIYIYPQYEYKFSCFVGLPAGADATNLSTFRIEASSTGQSGPVQLKNLQEQSVNGIGDPPSALSGIVRLSWQISAQALPNAVNIQIWQQQPTAWSFHVCTVSRRKA